MARKSVLVVEDDRDIRENLRDLMETEGYAVAVASNGLQALERLGEMSTAPGLILLDLMMPEMDGREFLDHVEKNPPFSSKDQLPIMVITAARDTPPPSAVGFMRKPLELDALMAVVEKYCGKPLKA